MGPEPYTGIPLRIGDARPVYFKHLRKHIMADQHNSPTLYNNLLKKVASCT